MSMTITYYYVFCTASWKFPRDRKDLILESLAKPQKLTWFEDTIY